VTSHDVARAAGVSQSVVSRAFTPGGKVAPATRNRVLRVARELGYHPNAFARSLVQQRAPIVGILMARIDNHFYPQVLEAFTSSLWASGRQTMLFNLDDEGEVDAMLLTALQYRVQAMIMTSITLSSHMAQAFSEAGVPVILFNRYAADAPVFAVSCDNVQGGRTVADALLEAGHARFAFIGGVPDSSTNQDRKAGFMARLNERGRKLEFVLEGDYSYAWGRGAASHLFSQPAPPDAVFCGNDLIAFGVLDTVRNDYGLRVPQDVSIVGFDDVPAAAWGSYALTTVRQPTAQMVEAVLSLLEPDAVRKSQRTLLPVSLIQRATSRKKGCNP